MVMSGQSVILTTLFLGRLRPPRWLTSTLCTYFCQYMTIVHLESAEGERSMWLDLVSNLASLALESDMLPTALCGLACLPVHHRSADYIFFCFFGITGLILSEFENIGSLKPF